MNKAVLIDGFWAGEFGEVEFFELGLQAGMSIQELSRVLDDVRSEDGTFYEATLDAVRGAVA